LNSYKTYHNFRRDIELGSFIIYIILNVSSLSLYINSLGYESKILVPWSLTETLPSNVDF
jgi:hypothetical protein